MEILYAGVSRGPETALQRLIWQCAPSRTFGYPIQLPPSPLSPFQRCYNSFISLGTVAPWTKNCPHRNRGYSHTRTQTHTRFDPGITLIINKTIQRCNRNPLSENIIYLLSLPVNRKFVTIIKRRIKASRGTLLRWQAGARFWKRALSSPPPPSISSHPPLHRPTTFHSAASRPVDRPALVIRHDAMRARSFEYIFMRASGIWEGVGDEEEGGRVKARLILKISID